MSRRDIAKLAVILAALAFAVQLAGRIAGRQDAAETETVREAIRNAAVTCYAVEGAYPDSLDYLKENYRLLYNEDRYFVTYEAFADNRMPDIYVTEGGSGIQ